MFVHTQCNEPRSFAWMLAGSSWGLHENGSDRVLGVSMRIGISNWVILSVCVIIRLLYFQFSYIVFKKGNAELQLKTLLQLSSYHTMLVVVRNHHILQKWNIATFIWLKSIYMKESTQDSRALEFCPSL